MALAHSILSAEDQAVGKVQSRAYKVYAKGIGGWGVVLALGVVMFGSQANIIGVDTFVSVWSAMAPEEQVLINHNNP